MEAEKQFNVDITPLADEQIRPIKGFPTMLHIEIFESEKLVKIHALIHTARDPDSHWGRTDWFVSEPEIVYGVAG